MINKLYIRVIEKEDFRSVLDSVRSFYRKRAVSLINQRKRKGEIAEMFGVNKNTIINWWKSCQERGLKSFTSKRKGVNPEDKKLLSVEKESAIQSMIADKMPEELQLNFSLWRRKALKELVEREYGIVLSINTMGDYLRIRGFSPQKP